jgi:hypothetical protein
MPSNEWACLLDTDFIRGMSPEKIQTIAQLQYGNDDLQFIVARNLQQGKTYRPRSHIHKNISLYSFAYSQ